MKIAEYKQMMAYLMRPKYQRGGYVRLKNGGFTGKKYEIMPTDCNKKSAKILPLIPKKLLII